MIIIISYNLNMLYKYSISQEICTRVFALLCFVVVIHWLIFPYPSGLLHWHCGNLTIAPVPAKQPWWIWINTSCEFIMNDCITTTKQSTTKPCAYFLGYTVPWPWLHADSYVIDGSFAAAEKAEWAIRLGQKAIRWMANIMDDQGVVSISHEYRHEISQNLQLLNVAGASTAVETAVKFQRILAHNLAVSRLWDMPHYNCYCLSSLGRLNTWCRHAHIHINDWQLYHVLRNCHDVNDREPARDNNLTLIQSVSRVPEPMLTHFTDAYMCHRAQIVDGVIVVSNHR